MAVEGYRLTPWIEVIRPDPDVAGGALEMGTYAANLARVFRETPGIADVYADTYRFFHATHLTEGMATLLEEVLGVLTGEKGDKVLQLRTPFGGGKTHSLLALLHLVRNRAEAIEAMPELTSFPNPDKVNVVVLSGEELDPLSPYQHPNGTETHTLWGEMAAQLGKYETIEEHDLKRSAPGGKRILDLMGDESTLILLDEVLVYVEKAMAVQHQESTLGRQAMLFIQALTEAVNSRRKTAMVYSLQASVGEAVGAEGLLSQLDHLVTRVDAKREPVTGNEVISVVQRRLFEDLGKEEARRAVASAYGDLVRKQLRAQAETEDQRREADVEAKRLEERILSSYPLHPGLLDLMYHRWGSLPSYQRTRGALQFLASVVHALWRARDSSPLIGPGEVALGDEFTRGAFFSQVGERERYTAVLDADILSEGSGAKTVDRSVGADAPGLAQLRVGTRMATAIMLYSFGAREGEERGVLESDLVATALVPGLDRNVIIAALHDLREEELYLHHTGRRYRFEPTPNLTKLVRDEANKFTSDEVLDEVRRELERLLNGRGVKVWPEKPDSIPDGIPVFTIAYLHPDWSTDKSPLRLFIEDAAGGKRRYRNALALVVPDSSQFDRARQATRTKLAVESLLRSRAKYGFRPDQVEELQEKASNASADLAATLGHAYSTAVIPVRAEEGQDAFKLEEVDLRSMLSAGRSLHDRVREALSHRVFDRLTVDKLIALAGLGPDRLFVACEDLKNWFFTILDFTKVTSTAAITDVISRGVSEGRIAYAAGGHIQNGELRLGSPDLLRERELLPVEEIDLGAGAFILTSEIAKQLRPGETEAEAEGGEKPGEEERDGEAVKAAPPPGESIRNVGLRVRVAGGGLFGLNRALSWLRDESDSLDVEVTVRATSEGDGIDQVRFRNGVVEPLEEGGAEITQQELS